MQFAYNIYSRHKVDAGILSLVDTFITSKALMKAAKRASKGGSRATGESWKGTAVNNPVWAPSLVQEGWVGVVASINSWGKQHVGWARCVEQNIAKVRDRLKYF